MALYKLLSSLKVPFSTSIFVFRSVVPSSPIATSRRLHVQLEAHGEALLDVGVRSVERVALPLVPVVLPRFPSGIPYSLLSFIGEFPKIRGPSLDP